MRRRCRDPRGRGHGERVGICEEKRECIGDAVAVGVCAWLIGVGLYEGRGDAEIDPAAIGRVGEAAEPAGRERQFWAARALEAEPAEVRAPDGAGAEVFSDEIEPAITDAIPDRVSSAKDWVDPFVGLRGTAKVDSQLYSHIA